MRSLTNTLQKLCRASRNRRTGAAARKRSENCLGIERLEGRALLAVVSHWTADNTAADSVGTNNGSLQSGTTYAAGQIGQAFSFDGINDRVGVADSDSLKLTRSLTIEAWIKINAFPTDDSVILFRGDDRRGFDPYLLATTSGGSVRFAISSITNEGASVQAPAPLGQFIHVAATLDDATGAMKLYENGVLMVQTTTSYRPFADLDPASNPGVGIGNTGGYPKTPCNFPFSGLIDDLKLYDHALTAADVLANFNAGKGSLQPAISINDTTIVEGDPSLRYQGNFVSPLEGGLDDPYALVYGPDGALYVSMKVGNSILRYDAVSGAPLPALGKPGAEFVSPGAGGLSQARGIAFGPDGNLYAVSTDTDAILRYDSATGTPLGALVASGVGGLDAPRGLLFHTDGFLYVTSVGGTSPAAGKDAILRFNAVTGAPAGISGVPGDAVFIASGSGGLDNPSGIVSHGGDFYVSSTSPSTSNSVLRYAANGTFLGAFVPTGSGGLSGPVDLVFRDGYLYVTSWANSKILRYDGASGSFVNEVASASGLARPIGLVFETNGNFLVASGDSDEIRRYGVSSQAVFTVRSVPWPTTISVDFGTANGTAWVLDDYQQTSGTLNFTPGMSSKTILVTTINDAVGESREAFSVNLSNAVGATILDRSATGTIRDDDATKFYVVNDASSGDRTYEYADGSNGIENYTLNSGNTAPRGAASNAAGDKVWVVDANKKVYVYNPAGGLLGPGPWTAGSLQSTAQVEGIATNGTDIWLVDNKTDKVFKYTGAASPLSGSQNAASSFNLASGNNSPKDIVTDGVSLWVVNDSTTDKVFKYTLSGSLVASWTIATSGAGSPTGITLDPSNPAHLWIVDSGTDRVYEYSNAVNQLNGSSVSAANSFALAAGNTDPQGIADPPPQGSQPATGTHAVPGRGSAESAYAPPAVASMSLSSLKKFTSELSDADNSLRGEFTGSRESDNLVGRSFELGLSKKPATKRLGEMFRQRDQIQSNDIAGGTDLDDLFADWSADPLQLLLSNGR